MTGVTTPICIGRVRGQACQYLHHSVVAFEAELTALASQQLGRSGVRFVTGTASAPGHGLVQNRQAASSAHPRVAVAAELVQVCDQHRRSTGAMRVVAVDALSLRRIMNNRGGLSKWIFMTLHTELSWLP